MRLLETTVLPGLTLADPFMIASSHWTESDNGFRQLARVRPAAITLKTVSKREGGAGEPGIRAREKHRIFNTFASVVGLYVDGPKTQELWDIPTAFKNSQLARKILPDTKLGLSVLFGEEYATLYDQLDITLYSYVELNWKYTFRGLPVIALPKAVEEIHANLQQFLEVFKDLPRIVKIPAEVVELLPTELFASVRDLISRHSAGVLVTNSKRIRVPPSRLREQSPRELLSGVVIGDYLFLTTFHALRELSALRDTREHELKLIATGGITDIGAVVDALAAGADAVQLCTALDLRGIQVVELLREQLHHLGEQVETLEEFRNRLRASSEAWYRIAALATSLEIDDDILYDTLRKNSQDIEATLEEAVKHDLQIDSIDTATKTSPEPIQDSHKYQFIIWKSNVGSYLLSQGCASHLRFTPIEIEDAKQFRRRLPDAHFQWDFAILPRSVVEHVLREGQNLLGQNSPEILAIVGCSTAELVGDTRRDLSSIEVVHHFSGVTSSAATERFLRERTVKRPPQFEDIVVDKLLPILRFWKGTNAILAKHPLTRIYSILCPHEVKSHWGPFWQSEEDLLLVCSRALKESSAGPTVIDQVRRVIEEIRNHLLKHSRQTTRGLVTGGFLAHCARLLGAKRIL